MLPTEMKSNGAVLLRSSKLLIVLAPRDGTEIAQKRPAI
jgi:hypothetical protein